MFPEEKHNNLSLFLKDYSQEISKGFESIDLDKLESIAMLINQTISKENRIFCCGNGGSSAISEHFVCDFLKGASTDSNISPVIYSLSSNLPTLTAVANDISYADIFSFQLEKYGKRNDLLFCVSSSGNSPNILKAIVSARSLGIKTVSFVGFEGGKAKELSDECIHIKVKNYGVVEDVHQSVMHVLSQYIRLINLKEEKKEQDIIF